MTRRAYDMKTFCDLYAIGKTYAYAEIGKGRLKAVKLGAKTLIRVEDAEAWRDALPELHTRQHAA